MRAVYTVIVCALIVTGCDVMAGATGPVGPQGPRGEQGPPAKGVVEGKRLKPDWRVGVEDVALPSSAQPRAFLRWYDAELKAPCDFALATDGLLRCIPTGIGPDTEWKIQYTDADCTAPILVVVDLCEGGTDLPKFVRYREGHACGGWHSRPILGDAEPTSVVHEVNAAGECVAAIAMTGAMYRTLGEEVDPEEMVPGSHTVDAPE